MTALPIVTRELRIASRQNRTYWSRLTTAAVLICITMMFLSSVSVILSPPRMGQQILIFFTFVTFFYSLSAGAQLTADCISLEKREGTLGLLFLTDLKGYDVVFGKLAATSLRSGYGLLSALPVMSILMLLGGVSLGEVFRIILVLINTLFLSLSAGLLFSSLCVKARNAVGWSSMVIVTLTMFLPITGMVFALYLDSLGMQVSKGIMLMAFGVWSPAGAAFAAFDNAYMVNAKLYWAALVVQHAIAWMMLWIACVMLPRRWQDRPASAVSVKARDRARDAFQGSSVERADYRRGLLDINPMLWLAHRDRWKTRFVWAFLGAAIVLWTAGWMEWPDIWIEMTPILTAIILHSTLKFWLASESVRQFSEDNRSGALELLLCTPFSVREILNGQLLALRRQFFFPAITVLALDCFLAAVFIGANNQDGGIIAGTFLLGMSIFALDLIAIAWLGMWMSLKAKDSKRAAGDTIVRIMVAPWIMLWVGFGGIAFLCWKLNFKFDPEPEFILGAWFIISVVVDVFFIRNSQKNLLAQFRALAMQRYLPPRPHQFWTILGRAFGEFMGNYQRRSRKSQ